ncbi:GNAT family protein [Clostridium sp.]|uniref:GNAT family N-acetyltransferase n=1 Tax=Clostridium sp. TaxID=1506 RepID=UPI0032174A6D
MKSIYETERLVLKVLDESDTGKVLDYVTRNKDYFKEFEPERADEFYTVEFQSNELRTDLNYIKGRSMLKLWIFNKDNIDKVIGYVTFYNIVPYAFLSCHIGYKSDKEMVNKGIITEAVIKGVKIMFEEYRMHRVEAHVMENNKPSIRVLEKIGFLNEGIAHKFLEVNGEWEDHLHYSLIDEDYYTRYIN